MDKKVASVCGQIVHEKMDAKNTFDEPECVQYKAFEDVTITEQGLTFTILPCSVVALQVTFED